MNTLILKLNATGDVVRTTTLLRRLEGDVTWVTASPNAVLLEGLAPTLRCLTWEERERAADRRYDLVINLEDESDVAAFATGMGGDQLFGAYLDAGGRMAYTDAARPWFDLSLISRFGREAADQKKLRNRKTYQELIFQGLGWTFSGEAYVLPPPAKMDLAGDVAISKAAGPVWPMKNWAFYDELQLRLEAMGLQVNVLPRRSSLLEHLGDVSSHRCLVSGDSLPMHLALGTSTSCVTMFTCTSPWEIHDYGVQRKIVSPLLEQYFYRRGYEHSATTAIGADTVFSAVLQALQLVPR